MTGHAQTPRLIDPPDADVVLLADVKAHLRVSGTDEDTLIQTYIDAAVSALDGWSGILGRCLITQTWAQDLDDFPAEDDLRLPFPDVQSVTVTYQSGGAQTFTAFRLAQDGLGSKLVLNDGATWPDPDDRPDAVTVEMVVGYGGASTDIPSALRVAILMHVAQMYDHRSVGGDGMPLAYDALVKPFRRVGV
jgi:uncharacterized phiE125 gp8 family phage protein